MPNQRKRSQSAKKQPSEKQLVMAQRSRSIKASLLKILSIDAASLYQMNAQQDRNSSKSRESNQLRQIIEDQAALHEQEEQKETNPTQLLESADEQSPPEGNYPKPSQQHISNRPVNQPQNEPIVMLLISRLIAFFIGMFIHYGIHSYFFNQSFALSGLAIAISAVSVLVTVIMMPWNQKLLWNLCSLFGGLLFAVIVL